MVRKHVAQLWSRRRNQKGMDYAKGRTMIGKFELGRIVVTPSAPRKCPAPTATSRIWARSSWRLSP